MGAGTGAGASDPARGYPQTNGGGGEGVWKKYSPHNYRKQNLADGDIRR